jgi:hypothetical protein
MEKQKDLLGWYVPVFSIEENNKLRGKKANFPKEQLTDSMTIPHYGPQYSGGIVWRPNNYRRQIRIFRNINFPQEIKDSGLKPTSITYGKVISIHNYKPQITIQVGRNNITAIYSQEKRGKHKVHYLIEADNQDLINQRIDQKKEEIRERIDSALLEFARRFKVLDPLQRPKWSRFEDFIKGTEYLDSIPADLVIHDTTFKKVYGRGIEFIKSKPGEEPATKLKQFIKNQVYNDTESRVIEHIDNVLLPVLEQLSYNLRTHITVLKGIDASFKRFNKTLDKLQQKKIKEWWG